MRLVDPRAGVDEARARPPSSTRAGSSRGHGPGAVRVAEHARAAPSTPSRRSTSRIPRSPPRRSDAPDRSRSTGPSPSALMRRDRGDVAGAERGGAQRVARAPLARQRDPGARRRAGAGADRRVVGALRELVQERVDRRERRLVVVGPRAVLRQPHDPARHRAGGEPLERRHRRVQVDVVAVDRVDVVAQPDARVGEPQPRRARELGEPLRERPGLRRARPARTGRGSPSGSDCRRASIQPATRPWSWLPASISSSPSGPSAAPASAKNGAASSAASRCGASRSSSPSPSMTSRSTPRERLDQRRAQLGAAQQVLAARRADVQVGDDERPHPTSVPRHGAARRHPRRRLLARARRPARGDAARRPRRRRGQGRAARRRRRHARVGPAVARRARRPTTSASTATSARSRSTSATPATSSSRAGSPAAPTC